MATKAAAQGHGDDARQNLQASLEAFQEADSAIQRWEHLAPWTGPMGSLLSAWSLARQLTQLPSNANESPAVENAESPASSEENATLEENAESSPSP